MRKVMVAQNSKKLCSAPPYTDAQWRDIDRLGRRIDAELAAGDVRLTQGGEPTYVAVDKLNAPEWNIGVLSSEKWALAEQLAWRLKIRFAPTGLLFYGQGKWYPGESLPRWAFGIYWRIDGKPVWRDPDMIAGEAAPADATLEDARRFAHCVAGELEIEGDMVIEAFTERPGRQPGSDSPSAGSLAGFVLPLRRGREGHATARWESSRWPVALRHLHALAGSAPLGCRLPLDSLPEKLAESLQQEVVRTALCTEVRAGRLHVFLPPLDDADDFLDLVAAAERTAEKLGLRVRLEGFPCPACAAMRVLSVTPDPGVIEVNLHPVGTWEELCSNIFTLDEEAHALHLGTEKFMPDGRRTGTGGGNHITLGGPTPADSPLLRKPELLTSLIIYWQNHPALSYLFSGMFVGPTSQAPRVDEARDDNLYELEIALRQIAFRQKSNAGPLAPQLIDRMLRTLLADLTGNTHRTEICIDKLYCPDHPAGRMGVVEFRAFEMPPHPQMNLVQALLMRALAARFWKTPYPGKLIRWGNQLHDRFMLPHFIAADMREVVHDLRDAGVAFEPGWIDPFVEFRFPRYGSIVRNGICLELRHALEPWNVLGEEMRSGSPSRHVDSSMERLQVKVTGMTGSGHVVTCNGRRVPLHPAGEPSAFVAGVRYRAWVQPSALHPTIGVHAPLIFDIVDTASRGSLGGCTYHVAPPDGRAYEDRPVSAEEARARRAARFEDRGRPSGVTTIGSEPANPHFSFTLDLRWSPEQA